MGLFRLNPRVLERLAMKRILDTEQLNIIGPRIKEARVRAGLSQKQLSEKLELMAVYP